MAPCGTFIDGIGESVPVSGPKTVVARIGERYLLAEGADRTLDELKPTDPVRILDRRRGVLFSAMWLGSVLAHSPYLEPLEPGIPAAEASLTTSRSDGARPPIARPKISTAARRYARYDRYWRVGPGDVYVLAG